MISGIRTVYFPIMLFETFCQFGKKQRQYSPNIVGMFLKCYVETLTDKMICSCDQNFLENVHLNPNRLEIMFLPCFKRSAVIRVQLGQKKSTTNLLRIQKENSTIMFKRFCVKLWQEKCKKKYIHILYRYVVRTARKTQSWESVA